MSEISQELQRLAELHQSGRLSDDEYTRAKARVLDGQPRTGCDSAARREAPAVAAVNALRRSRNDRWIGGVCGGIARITGLESWIWRLMITLLALFGGTGIVAYLLLWIFVPEE